jgi:hypothetical protein
VHAFVARRPDENHERVYRWLLERNLKLYGVAFALDHMGDIYLDGRLPLSSVTPDELDRLLAIRREWEWRKSRGESTRNLEAFRGWLEKGEEPPAPAE